ncbi:MAG: hypothetical protein QOG15_74 [Solirubrobacteraceae bacterium]|jgi:very-short-patch-repair endonuclease|nr:hypothetical protein [Solirubrobacteraceae bacterium]
MEGSRAKRRHSGRSARHPRLEQQIADRARRQHNVIALRQLRELGLSDSAVRSRVAAGRLHRVHPGVYAVGHPNLTGHGRWKAAELVCGADSALSHRSCGGLRGLRPDNRAVIDVTTPSGNPGRRRAGIVAHQGKDLLPRDIQSVDGIRCTSLARTLLDLAEVLDQRGLERVLDQAEILQVLDMTAINDVLTRADGRRGAPILKNILGEHYPGSTVTKTTIEELFLQICRDAHVPRPEVNVWIPIPGEEWQVDFVWRQQRLIVETDGHETHGTRQAFERDRRRDQRLTLEGWSVIRFTWRQILNEPHYVADTLHRLLSQAA